MKRHFLVGLAFVAALVALGVAQRSLEQKVDAQAAASVQAPRFEVDPAWPKPLPNNWNLGQTIGVSVDANDHVWIIHRDDALDDVEAAGDLKTGACCSKASPILEFDQDGNLLRHWGGESGPGYEWPTSNHGLWIDYKGNLWTGGNGGNDGQVLKFTRDGKFLLKIGGKFPAPDSNSTERFWKVAKVHVYPKTNEVFVADGYGNRRVAVLDADTGAFKRYWGAYGNKPEDKDLGRYDPNCRPRSSSADRSTAPSRPTMAWCMSAIARATASRYSRSTASIRRKCSSSPIHLEMGRRGTSSSRRTRSRSIYIWPTAAIRRFTSSIALR